MGELQDGLPPEFDACLNGWRHADRDAQICLAWYQIEPTLFTRRAFDAALAALEASLGTLEPWVITHPQTRASRAVDYAQSSWNGLHAQIERVGLLEDWATNLPRH